MTHPYIPKVQITQPYCCENLKTSHECLHLVVVGVFAALNDLMGYASRNFMFLEGPPKPDRPQERSQTERDKLVLQAWGFCGWAGNPPKENKVLISKDTQPRISADQMTNDLKRWQRALPEQVKRPNAWRKMMMMMMTSQNLHTQQMSMGDIKVQTNTLTIKGWNDNYCRRFSGQTRQNPYNVAKIYQTYFKIYSFFQPKISNFFSDTMICNH
jgi:hypothetical protein